MLSLANNLIIGDFPSWLIPIDILQITCYGLTTILALLFLFIIVYDKLYNTISMLLIANSCLTTLILSSSCLAMTIRALRNDIQQIYFYDEYCTVIAYIIYMSIGAKYYSYLLQALHRYFLIVYPNRLAYQSFKFNIFLIMLTWMCYIIYPLPLALTGQFKFIIDAQICQVPLGFSTTILCNVLFIFVIPMLSITIFYLKLVRYVKEMSKNVTTVNRLFHVKRELKMVRRIVSLLFILVVLGLPYSVFIFMSFFTSPPKYAIRLAYTFVSISLVPVMIILLRIAEPLKVSIMKRITRRRINAIHTVT